MGILRSEYKLNRPQFHVLMLTTALMAERVRRPGLGLDASSASESQVGWATGVRAGGGGGQRHRDVEVALFDLACDQDEPGHDTWPRPPGGRGQRWEGLRV